VNLLLLTSKNIARVSYFTTSVFIFHLDDHNMDLGRILDKELQESVRKATLEAAKLMTEGEKYEVAKATDKINRRYNNLKAAIIIGGTISLGSLAMNYYTDDNTWKGLLYGTLGSMAVAVGCGYQSIRYNAGTMNGIMLSNKHKLIEKKYGGFLREMREYQEEAIEEDTPEESPPRYQQ